MQRSLLIQNQHWNGDKYQEIMERDLLRILINKISLKEINILLGVRRAGKSTLFKILINHLLKTENPQSILYVNLDDPLFHEVWQHAKELYKVIETAEKITGVKTAYLFLDEIQNVKYWEKFIKSVYDSNLFKKIFITGSNSSLLKNNYASLLSGRYTADYVYPLSYREILAINNIKTNIDLLQQKPLALRLIDDMLFYGSFPEIFKIADKDLKREVLLSYYETIVVKDCIFNHRILETKTLQELALYLLTNTGNLYSYNGLAKFLGSNENTVKHFINIFQNGFLLNEIRNFSPSLKSQTVSKKKSYCVDNGLIGAVAESLSDLKGKLFENLVYTELQKLHFKDIYFSKQDQECDFIIKKGSQLIALQVSLILNAQNKDREIGGLKLAMKNFAAKKGYIVTLDQEEVIEENIAAIPFWKMFFDCSF